MSDTSAGRTGQCLEEWIAFTGWVVLFLIAPATPQLLQQFRSDDDFRVMYEGPVLFSDHAAYSLEIQNNGRRARHNVEVWAPLPPGGDVVMQKSPYEFSEPKLLEPREREGYRIFNIGDLQPGERYAIGIHTTWAPRPSQYGAYPDIPWIMAKVVSSGTTASALGWRSRALQDEMSLRWSIGAFNLMSAAVVFLLILVLRTARQAAPPVSAKLPAPKEAWRRPPRPASLQDRP